MQKKRRTGSASTKRPVDHEIAHLRGLDLRVRPETSRWIAEFSEHEAD